MQISHRNLSIMTCYNSPTCVSRVRIQKAAHQKDFFSFLVQHSGSQRTSKSIMSTRTALQLQDIAACKIIFSLKKKGKCELSRMHHISKFHVLSAINFGILTSSARLKIAEICKRKKSTGHSTFTKFLYLTKGVSRTISHKVQLEL